MPEGGTLRLECVRTATEVHLRIRDSGIGMSAELVPRIFEPLYTTKPGGTGLGLYIVREILVAHGGGVTVESVEGQGTTFVLMFPVPE
jgi:signal transduction histidine kinase